jgi:MFS family permease
VASVLCAVSPTIETLILARLVQGLAGAVGIAQLVLVRGDRDRHPVDPTSRAAAALRQTMGEYGWNTDGM